MDVLLDVVAGQVDENPLLLALILSPYLLTAVSPCRSSELSRTCCIRGPARLTRPTGGLA